MKTVRATSVLLCLVLAVGIAQAQPRVEPPTYQVGDRWVRSDGAWDLVRVEDDRYVFSSRPGHEMHFTKSLALVRWTRGPRGFSADPPLELQWPLKVGQVAVGEPRWITSNCPASCTRRVTLSVDDYEEVSVPAGTFKAFKISLESAPPHRARLRWPPSHPGAWTASIVLWYAPELGRYVKMEIDRDFGGRGDSSFSAVLLDVDRPAPLAIALTGPAADARVDSATLPFLRHGDLRRGVRQSTSAPPPPGRLPGTAGHGPRRRPGRRGRRPRRGHRRRRLPRAWRPRPRPRCTCASRRRTTACESSTSRSRWRASSQQAGASGR